VGEIVIPISGYFRGRAQSCASMRQFIRLTFAVSFLPRGAAIPPFFSMLRWASRNCELDHNEILRAALELIAD
jgi:hypothetical protein